MGLCDKSLKSKTSETVIYVKRNVNVIQSLKYASRSEDPNHYSVVRVLARQAI